MRKPDENAAMAPGVPDRGAAPLFGPRPTAQGTAFRLWAPDLSALVIHIEGRGRTEMVAAGEGFFEASLENVGPGARYRFESGALVFPDPAARSQAEDADGWSLVVAPLPPGRLTALRPFREAVIAEVHVGAATAEGTFAALTERLPHYAEAGYTAIELMPINEFEGRFNWGYDGVLLFAPDRSYGTPQELRALVDRAHALGLAVIVDLVYNHFGTAANFLPSYASAFFGAETPWGRGFAFDHPIVARFFHENVAMWLRDYDMDGARFDAVHELGSGAVQEAFVRSLTAAARSVKPDAWMIAENSWNVATQLEHGADGRPRIFDAQWNEDFQHVLQHLLAGETEGFVCGYVEDPVGKLDRTLREGFIYQGEVHPHDGRHRGEPSGHLPPTAFVNFTQNHDQVGNRPRSDRMAAYLDDARLDFSRALTMLAPQIPLFLMGEEANDDTPFHFFSDAPAHMRDAVRKGRTEQVIGAYALAEPPDLPDAWAPETLDAARVGRGRWEAAAIERFRALADLRARLIVPLLATPYRGAGSARSGDALLVRWHFEGGTLAIAVNPTGAPQAVSAPVPAGAAVCGTADPGAGGTRLGPFALAVWAEEGTAMRG
ncbi:alpha-amylase family glycosyl hydrolase [Prosthecomicrobium pneumaticum]|uniref:Malto-oligosyltrehalose trehalohydrolase n=1 Tax=Prosthecomicrobium pneumaticum TaxID=81895 RepID=A0A7W9L3U7_9HYPH|nr:alpha-amylase family glycosyl hydrolase [Prosthecomicrobium pneumaticum]MBB5754927.1 malto-oligosyltrehalose trehalohydrolase [Prosthecomicrobium pneumaticum]